MVAKPSKTIMSWKAKTDVFWTPNTEGFGLRGKRKGFSPHPWPEVALHLPYLVPKIAQDSQKHIHSSWKNLEYLSLQILQGEDR